MMAGEAREAGEVAAARRRAAWMLAIVIPAPSIGAAMAFWVAPGAAGNAAYTAGKALLYGIPLLALLFLDGRSVLGGPKRAHAMAIAVGLGLLISAVILAGFGAASGSLATGQLASRVEAAGIGTPARFLLLSAYLVLVNSFLEELAFRWFLITRLRLFVGGTVAAVLASLAFTAHHVVVLAAFFPAGLVLACSAGVLVGGLIWSWCFVRFGSIWPGYVSHAIVDIAVLGIGWQLIFSG